MTKIGSKGIDALDLMKLLLCLVIAAVHINPYGKYRLLQYPLSRLAIPLFFIISSYLLFTKLTGCNTEKEKDQTIKKYCKREAKLYLFWLIVLLPVVLQNNKYFSFGIINGMIRFLQDLLLGSTFTGSWYLTASIICVVLICYAFRRLNNAQLFFIGCILYAISCLSSNYYFLLRLHQEVWAGMSL